MILLRKLKELLYYAYMLIYMPVRKLIIEIETDSVIKRLVWLGGKVRLEGKNFIGTKCELTDVEIGYGSYLSEGCSLEKVSIGRFTSVGKNLNVSAGNHPIRTFVSSHPFFYSSHIDQNEYGSKAIPPCSIRKKITGRP